MIDHLQSLLLDSLGHAYSAAIIIGLLAFGESMAVIGAVIPATPALLLIGTLLGQGILQPLQVIPAALGGALCGYWLSWKIGKRLQGRAYRSRWVATRRRSIARLRLFFRRWGGPSLVFGRFVLGPLQSMLPLVAGTMGMTSKRFHFWNFLSAMLWVPVVLTPGYLAGRGLVPLGISRNVMAGITLTLAAISVAGVVVALSSLVIRVRRGSVA